MTNAADTEMVSARAVSNYESASAALANANAAEYVSIDHPDIPDDNNADHARFAEYGSATAAIGDTADYVSFATQQAQPQDAYGPIDVPDGGAKEYSQVDIHKYNTGEHYEDIAAITH